MSSLSLVIFLSVLLGFTAAQFNFIKEETFDKIKISHGHQFVTFYRSSNSNHLENLKEINNAAENLSSEYPNLIFFSCDGDKPENQRDFKQAKFENDIYLFTQVPPDQGIQKYTHNIDTETIIQHIHNMYAPYDEKDIVTFTNEEDFYDLLDSEDIPIIIKFYEQWCTHCKAFKKPFNIAATMFNSRARFVEVECSKDQDTRTFCSKHNIKSFPIIMAFDSERKAKFEYESRSVISIQDFINKFTSKMIGDTFDNDTMMNISISPTGTVIPESKIHKQDQSLSNTRSELKNTPNTPNLGRMDNWASRVESLERTVEALILRIEQLERK